MRGRDKQSNEFIVASSDLYRCDKSRSLTRILFSLLVLGHNVSADENNWWEQHGSFQLDGVVSGTFLDIQETPFNQALSLKDFAGLSDQNYGLELRPNIELDLNACNINLKPRYRTTYLRDQESASPDSELFMNTALADCRLADSINLKVGRQRLAWGNSQFRSPSNPFFAESVLFNPVYELIGKEFAVLDYSANFNWKFSAIANWDESHLDQPANPNYQFIKSYGVKAEYTAQSSQWGGIISQREAKPLRVGGFSNYTLNRALLVYGEFSVSKDSNGLLPVAANNNLLPSFEPADTLDKKYRYSFLAGANYTFMNGWNGGVEYLHSNEGFSSQQAAAWRDAGAIAISMLNTEFAAQASAVAVSAIDPLWRQLRQNYLILNLNRTEYRNVFDVAFQNITNLDDGSNSIAASVVYHSSDNTELFLVANANSGGGSKEFERLISSVVLIGLRFYTF